MVEQFIASKLTKAGIRTNVSGIYSHMLPDINGDLQGYYTDETKTTRTGKPMEVAVPWSMFVEKQEGESNEDAEKRAYELLAKQPELFKMVLIRVPGSAAVSKFAGQVKYFTDGTSNTTIVPKEFVLNADADHDGDKIFAYRGELNAESEIVQGNKTIAFDKMYDLAYSENMIKQTNDTLDLEVLRKAIEEAGVKTTNLFNLQTEEDNARLANNMSFGADAIGIWAIASKMLSMLSQSKESLRKPLLFENSKGEILTLEKFSNNSLGDVARFLQAALDMANDPVHVSTGLNKHTIHIGVTLSLLGVDATSIVKFMNNPVIKKLVNDVSRTSNNYNSSEYVNFDKYIEEQRVKADSKDIGLNVESLERLMGTNFELKNKFEDGVYKAIDDSNYYFELKNTTDNKYAINKIAKSEIKGNENLEIIKKFQEINRIGKSLQRLIPIMGLDNKLPNNGFDVKQVLELFNALQENIGESEEFMFTTDNFRNRPLLVSFRKLLAQQQKIYIQRFVTENPEYYRIANDLALEIFGKNIAEYKQSEVYKAIIESFDLFSAQKQLVKNVKNAKVFIDSFAIKMQKIIDVNSGEEVLIAPDKPLSMSQTVYDREVEAYHSAEARGGLDAYIDYQKSKAEGYAKKYPNSKQSDNIPYSVWVENIENVSVEGLAEYEIDEKGMIFINHLEAIKKDDKDKTEIPVINPNSVINQYSVDQIEELQKSFEYLPADLQEEIVSYSMFRFGIASKLNSISKMLPSRYEMKVMKYNTNLIFADDNLGGYFENESVRSKDGLTKGELRMERTKLNAAILLKNSLPKPTLFNIGPDGTADKMGFNKYSESSNGTMEVNTESNYVNINDKVYIRYFSEKGKSRLFFDSNSLGGFNNGVYKQMVLNTKSFDLDFKELIQQGIELQKIC